MASVGTIEQYQGPFEMNHSIILNGPCVIGISVGEDDFMYYSSPSSELNNKLEFKINNDIQTIFLGRTYIYLTDTQIDITNITFPTGAPESLLLNVVYCNTLE